MKKIIYMIAVTVLMGALLQGCGARNENVDTPQPSTPSENNTITSNNTENNAVENNETENNPTDSNPVESIITKEMAYEGVDNYCHSEYDWSAAEDDPSMMYMEMGEETEAEYQVVFHSYTGAVVYFYVDKVTGTTRMVEYVPVLDIENEVGTIDIHDYLGQ